MQLYYLDSFTRVMGAAIRAELHEPKIRCKPDEFSGFNPPEGQTCGSWANKFVSAFGGYLDDANNTSACRPPTAIGEDFFIPLNIKWRDAFVVFAFFIFNFLLVVITSKLLRFAKR